MPQIPDKPSNQWLAKLFTSEFIISAIVVIFTAGVLWNNIQIAIAQAQSAANASAAKADRVEVVVSQIQTDVEVIKQKQINAAEKMVEQSEELAEQRKDIKAILRLLGGGNGAAH